MQAQAKFAESVKEKDAVWKRAEEGWKLYEPLPQTAEEEVLYALSNSLGFGGHNASLLVKKFVD